MKLKRSVPGEATLPSSTTCCGCRPPRWRGAGRAASWLLPAALLAAIPKCPVCLAAYIALFTGIICPAGTASLLRHAVVAVCVALLFISLVRLVRCFCNR
ncbi:hypothetical protein OVA24_10145 [Luteolibacter sp. SL250]|uniref:hypothetical protein n=1 Tax=Luteolibacter sp. SL250 TaxID=2995170 RepID=UPI0022713FD5|nr:hypothetical protein [Luteolibacter sp. SL250]WAC21745.1 hypothetical protein OVA24_10145 [Luteolibacter sp. SL250]